jgi:hypothetical protein
MSETTIRSTKQLVPLPKRAARISRRAIGGLIVAAGAAILIADVSEQVKGSSRLTQLSPAVSIGTLPSLAVAPRR